MKKSKSVKKTKVFDRIHGRHGRLVLDKIEKISPDFAKYIMDYPYGKIYQRKTLSLKSKQIATIAALATLGYAPAQLKSHIMAGRKAGLTKEEIIDIFLHLTIYAGFPAALNALYIAAEVFEKEDERKKRGK